MRFAADYPRRTRTLVVVGGPASPLKFENPSAKSWRTAIIPAEHAFAAHCQAVLVRLDQLEEVLEVIVFDVGVDQFFALAIHQADVHLAGVQIDSTVELGGGGAILHTLLQ